MRIIQILLAMFLVLYAINIYVNRPSARRHMVIDGITSISTESGDSIHVTLEP